MRSGMGNLLETDSDVASISDNEKERTDGDGMESNVLLDTNRNVSLEPTMVNKSVTVDASSSPTSMNNCSVKLPGANDKTPVVALPASRLGPTPGTSRSHVTSPRELPPRSQLIQLKPTMCKPKLSSKQSTDSITDITNPAKQKNPRFIPYEPYRGAVRPIVQDESKKHSRTGSDASFSSISLEQAVNNISIDGNPIQLCSEQNQSVLALKNTPEKLNEQKQLAGNKIVDHLTSKKQDQRIEKQTNALTLIKERLKVAEKDNFDLHKENTRLKKLLVDSLSGDLLHGRSDITNDPSQIACANSESVDALSNEIEVWRSKFLSSCVLVEQLTRENGVLNDAVASAANILKEIKLSSTLLPEHFEEVNVWLRQNRGTTPSMTKNED